VTPRWTPRSAPTDGVHLEVRDLRVNYDGIQAVHGVSFSGAARRDSSPDRRERRGQDLDPARDIGAHSLWRQRDVLGRTPARRRRAPDRRASAWLTCPRVAAYSATSPCRENLRLSTWQRRDRQGIAQDLERVLEIFPRLGERLDQTSGTLSGGEQQMLAVGRALMTRASLRVAG
jgi:branched-chain amino acid transport system ATP-binding protein